MEDETVIEAQPYIEYVKENIAAISEAQERVQKQVDALLEVFQENRANNEDGDPADSFVYTALMKGMLYLDDELGHYIMQEYAYNLAAKEGQAQDE